MDEAPGASPPRLPNRAAAVVATWLLPGAGHLMIRRPWPGAVFALAILPLFAGGLVLAGFENVSWDRHPWLFGLQALTGVPAGVTALLTRETLPTNQPHRSVGDLFTCAAGLLNLVAMADVWARCTLGDPETRRIEPESDDVESLVRPSEAGAPPATERTDV